MTAVVLLVAVSMMTACGTEIPKGGAAEGGGGPDELRGGNVGNGAVNAGGSAGKLNGSGAVNAGGSAGKLDGTGAVGAGGSAGKPAGSDVGDGGRNASGDKAGGGPGGADGTAGADEGAGVGGTVGVMGPSTDCTFEIATSGARVISYAPELLGCTTFDGPRKGLEGYFVKADGTQTLVAIADLQEGQTGSAFSAKLSIAAGDVGYWQTTPTGCTVEVTAQVLLGTVPHPSLGDGRQYRITGQGTCSETAKDVVEGQPELSVGDFAFRVRKTWHD